MEGGEEGLQTLVGRSMMAVRRRGRRGRESLESLREMRQQLGHMCAWEVAFRCETKGKGCRTQRPAGPALVVAMITLPTVLSLHTCFAAERESFPEPLLSVALPSTPSFLDYLSPLGILFVILMCLLITYLSPTEFIIHKGRKFLNLFALIHHWHLAHFLTHNKCLINICWMNPTTQG